jgi:hypothetical protein
LKTISVILIEVEGYWMIKTRNGKYLQHRCFQELKAVFGTKEKAASRFVKKDIREVAKIFGLTVVNKFPKSKQSRT